MAHTFRFIAKPVDASYWAICDDGERHHCRKVLKLAAGARVEVTDGAGNGASGTLCPLPSAADLQPPVTNAIWVKVEQSWQTPKPKLRLHMVLGAIKPTDWDQVLPPLAEIGVASIQVYAAEGAAKFRIDDKIKLKAAKILQGAIKQSKRDYLPELNLWPSLNKALDYVATGVATGAQGAEPQRFVLAAEDAVAIDTITPPSAGDVVVVVGDEAGIAAESMALLKREGFRAVSFGEAIYRAKTAAICGAFFFRGR